VRYAVLLAVLVDTSGKGSAFDAARSATILVVPGGDDFAMNAVVSPGGGWMAAPRRDGKVSLWSGGKAVTPLDAHDGYVYAAAFAPDGQRLATGGLDSSVKIWTLSNRFAAVLKGHTGAVHSLAWSPDGTLLASAGDDGLRVWKGGQAVFARSPLLLGVAFSPDGGTIATAGFDGVVRLWSTDGKEKKALKGHAGGVLSVAYSPGGRLASAGLDKVVRLWDAEGKAREFEMPGVVRHVAFDPSGRKIATAGTSGVRVIDLDTGKVHLVRGRAASSAVFSGGTLVAAHCDNRIRVNGAARRKVDADEADRVSGFLGVSYGDENGAKISSVVEDSQAKALGFAENDVIVGIEDVAVTKSDDFLNFMRGTLEGDEVLLKVKRAGEDRVFRAKLGRWK
jgi:WD40 repeat protein